MRLVREFVVALKLKKVQMPINRPFYVGLAVLDLRILHMYKYHPQLFNIVLSLIVRGP